MFSNGMGIMRICSKTDDINGQIRVLKVLVKNIDVLLNIVV